MFYLFREETSNIRRSASQSSIIVFSFTFPSRPSRPSSSRCSSHFLATRSRSVRVAERRDGFKVRAKLLSRSNRERIQLVTLIRGKKEKKKRSEQFISRAFSRRFSDGKTSRHRSSIAELSKSSAFLSPLPLSKLSARHGHGYQAVII